jgi:hypothetical protein
MYAYEFFAIPKNGTLPIPEQYRGKINTKVKVIILDESSESKNEDNIDGRRRTDSLSPISINTHGWKFDKEEANER